MTGWLFRSKSCTCLATDTITGAELQTEDLPSADLIEDEPFEWLAIAGQGGMGTVYKATDKKLNRFMAVKIIQQDTDDPRAAETFLREAKAASKLQHPNIVTVADFGLMKDGRQFLAIEWIDGITLAEYLNRHGALTVEAAEEIFVQVLDGLSHAHNRGVIHRDIKPKNIMLSRTTSGGWTVKLIDFGSAKDLTEDGFQTRAEDMACSPFYVSPERVNGLLVDYRADLYSLGCTFFEALTGRPPFRGAALHVVMMHIGERPPTLSEASDGKQFPKYVEDIVARLLAKHPDDRFQNAEEAKVALEQRFVESDAGRLEEGAGSARKEQKNGKQIVYSASLKGLVPVITAVALGAAIIWFFVHALLQVSDDNSFVRDTPATSLESPARKVEKSLERSNFTSNLLSFEGVEITTTASGTKVTVNATSDRDIAKLKQVKNIDHLTLTGLNPMRPQMLDGLRCRTTVKRLNINQCTGLGPDTLFALKDFPKLELLNITSCRIGKETLPSIVGVSTLSKLEIEYCDFDGDAFNQLDKINWIAQLSLDGCKITDRDLAQLKHLDKLDRINLSNTALTGSCFESLPFRKTLRVLLLHHCPDLQPDSLKLLSNYPRLSSIEYNGNRVTKIALLALKQVPALEALMLPNCDIEGDAYPVLGDFSKLTGLSISDTTATDESIRSLKHQQELVYLNLKGTSVTRRGLNELRKYCKKLTGVPTSWGMDQGTSRTAP